MKELNLIKAKLGEYNISGDEHLFYCPFCFHHKRKLSINFKKGFFKCWVCVSYGEIGTLLKKLGYKEYSNYIAASKDEMISLKDNVINKFSKKNQEEKWQNKIRLPKEYKNLISNRDKFSINSMKYLFNRGIQEEDIIIWKIGYCLYGEYEGCIIIPSFDEFGELDYFAIKSYINPKMHFNIPKEIVEKKNIIFNSLLINWNEPLILTEGIFDAIKSFPNSVPLLGKILYENSKLFHKIIENNIDIYIALDNDAKKQELNLISLLKDYGIRVFKVQTKDIEDIGSISKKELKKRIEQAIEITSIAKYKLLEM